MPASLDEKIRILDGLQQGRSPQDLSKLSRQPLRLIKQWQAEESSLRREYLERIHFENARTMTQVHARLADKALELVNALSSEKMKSAALNQIATSLSIVIDRFLKLQENMVEEAEQVIRFEFRHPDGTLRPTPYWSSEHHRASSALQGSDVRQTLRENGAGANGHSGESPLPAADDMVARPDLFNGERSLAEFEESDAERNWSPR